jgi:hypothetical protein
MSVDSPDWRSCSVAVVGLFRKRNGERAENSHVPKRFSTSRVYGDCGRKNQQKGAIPMTVVYELVGIHS